MFNLKYILYFLQYFNIQNDVNQCKMCLCQKLKLRKNETIKLHIFYAYFNNNVVIISLNLTLTRKICQSIVTTDDDNIVVVNKLMYNTCRYIFL